jgi:hypothetical protein
VPLQAAIEASKQANAAFKVEIQALDAVKRDQYDGVIVTTFNDRHQALKTQITELEVALALILFNSIKRLYLYLKRRISLL